MQLRIAMLRMKKAAMVALCGTVMQFGPLNCDLGEFTATSSVTLDGRTVISTLIRATLLTPIEDAIDRGIDYVFDKLEGDEV